MNKNVVVIGSGFSGISVATNLAQAGYSVKVLEKNTIAGGRARFFIEQGFKFDMGPSWYWMPDIIEDYFNRFGKSTSDYFSLSRLDPSYSVIFDQNTSIDIPADFEALKKLFDSFEPGSGKKLAAFLEEAAYKYEVGMKDLAYRPGRSIKEFLDPRLIRDIFKMDIFSSYHKHVRRYFKHPYLIKIAEFPILFLGAVPRKTPALYSLMNYADMCLGTWYPEGGMGKLVEGMVDLAKSMGVEFLFEQNVVSIEVDSSSKAIGVQSDTAYYSAEIVVAAADYHHVETQLLGPEYRAYSDAYWNSRVLAPSCLLFYLGVNKPLQNLNHHNLFFDEDFDFHATQIYDRPEWPDNPLFYVAVTSKSDRTVAPEGCENLFVLMPVATDLPDDESTREYYYQLIMDRLEKLTKQSIRPNVIYRKSYAHSNFIADYNAFKGNAYGLANTLRQTALLKPSIKSRKVKNLYYTGQLTVPGPGVPPSLISGQLVAREIQQDCPVTKINH